MVCVDVVSVDDRHNVMMLTNKTLYFLKTKGVYTLTSLFWLMISDRA